MMRTSTLFAATLISLVSLSQQAQAQSASLDLATRSTVIRGEVPRVCSLRGVATVINGSNASLASNGVGSATITITQLVNQSGSDGLSQGATLQFEIPATCSVSHDISFGSANGGLTLNGQPGAPDVNGFRNILPYGLTANWNGIDLAGQTNSGGLISRVPDAATGKIIVAINIPAGGTPLVAGSYSDALSISLSPTF